MCDLSEIVPTVPHVKIMVKVDNYRLLIRDATEVVSILWHRVFTEVRPLRDRPLCTSFKSLFGSGLVDS